VATLKSEAAGEEAKRTRVVNREKSSLAAAVLKERESNQVKIDALKAELLHIRMRSDPSLESLKRKASELQEEVLRLQAEREESEQEVRAKLKSEGFISSSDAVKKNIEIRELTAQVTKMESKAKTCEDSSHSITVQMSAEMADLQVLISDLKADKREMKEGADELRAQVKQLTEENKKVRKDLVTARGDLRNLTMLAKGGIS